jgi:hypothetical protein
VPDAGEEVAFWKPRLSDLEVSADGGDDDDEEEEADEEAEEEAEEEEEFVGEEDEEEEAGSSDGAAETEEGELLDEEFDGFEETAGEEDYDAWDEAAGAGEEEEEEAEEEEGAGYDEGGPSPPLEGEDEDDPIGSDPAEDLGVPQRYPADAEGPVLEALGRARDYVRAVVHSDADPFPEVVRTTMCKNQDPRCAVWASWGECEHNPSFMGRSCAPVCRTCHLLHAATRCERYDPNQPTELDALKGPGSLNRLFERIVGDPWLVERYGIRVLSRPDFASGDTPETADYQLGLWLLRLDSFSSPEECQRLVELGHLGGYERSSDVGEEKEDGTYEENVNSGRTSTNSVRCLDRVRGVESQSRSIRLCRLSRSPFSPVPFLFLPVVRGRVPGRPARPGRHGAHGQRHADPRRQPGVPAAAPVRFEPTLRHSQ